MSDIQETFAEIVAEWRECLDATDPAVWNDRRIAGLVENEVRHQREYMNRLEAAHRRELATLNLAVSSAHDALREVIEQNCSHCHKRELAAGGDAAAMREACKVVIDAIETIYAHEDDAEFVRVWLDQTKKACEEALAEPPRNCDVGTPEEQEARFDEFCVSHYTPPNKDGVVPDGCDCPCYVRGKGCNAFIWAQMPYEEGGAE